MILHLPCHFKSKHRNDPEIKDALMKTEKRRFDKLRAKGDDMHNELVLKEGKGELIISRRPVEFQVIDFAPCYICYEWMNMKYIDKHHKKNSFRKSEKICHGLYKVSKQKSYPIKC